MSPSLFLILRTLSAYSGRRISLALTLSSIRLFGLYLLVCTFSSPLLGARAATIELIAVSDPQIQEVILQLRRVWQREQATASRPFPMVLPLATISPGACHKAPFPSSLPLLLACPGEEKILLNHRALVGPRKHFGPGNGAVAFLVAYGLGQSLVPPPPGSSLPPATSGLRSACLAGTLLGAMATGHQSSDSQRIDAAIRLAAQAFPDSAADQLGTGPQRAYAVLSGLGATALDCGADAMARLADGQVPVDPDLGSRGPGSMDMEVACRKPPPCPRRIPSGEGGV
jgi:hypothetical protein